MAKTEEGPKKFSRDSYDWTKPEDAAKYYAEKRKRAEKK